MKKLATVGVVALLAATFAPAAPFDAMDYGPFVSATFELPKGNTALRGVAVPFDAPVPGEEAPDKARKAGVVFDTELLRYAGYWNGGFITYGGVVFDGNHGKNPGPAGEVHVATKPGPGWAKDGTFADPRPIPNGPLPRDWARYKGLYRHHDGIVFAYTVGNTLVLDKPSVDVVENTRLFRRTLNLNTGAEALVTVVADLDKAKGEVKDGIAFLRAGNQVNVAHVTGGPAGTAFEIAGERIILKIPANSGPTKIAISQWRGSEDQLERVATALAKVSAPADLTPLTKGGEARFTKTVTTKGELNVGRKGKKDAKDDGPYVFDSITPPFENPYKSWIRFGGFDFFKDGRAAVCTWSGDVWIASGIDDTLENITWKRYAAGLFQALGLKIVDDKVYVLGRDQITRLHDLNNDGEADFYECFNNDVMITKNFHEFIFDLHTDPEGNFYFVRGGPVRPGGSGWDPLVPHHGCLFKVAKDGSKLEVIARGFRAPNGMAVGPHGEITCGDNEGTWTPTCPINWVKPNGFYGVPEFAKKDPKTAVRDNPLCWLPRSIDNSNGGQVWIDSDKFGPLSGRMLHMSYGQSTLYEVLQEEVGGQKQGGVVPLLRFDSGVCRARFAASQNALFLTGLRGWQTNANKDAGFYRVRYTEKKANLPIDLKVRPGEVSITFSDPLDKSLAQDADSFNLERWNYRWTSNYGSPEIKVSDAKKTGHDPVEVESASLSADGKTITLKIRDLAPVMQLKIAYNLKAADGAPVRNVIHSTINVVGDQRGEVHPGEFRVVRDTK